MANGNNVQWYSAPIGGSPLSTASALTNNATYYASQTVGICESETRLPVTVSIADPSAPTGTSTQNFCAIDSATVADLVANGNNVQWYSAPTGGTLYLNTTPLVNGLTYYATQIVGSCKSASRLNVTVLINQNPILSLSAPSVCSGTDALITASPTPSGIYTYSWNVPTGIGNPGDTSSFTTSIAGNYAVIITDIHGCSDSGAETLVFYINPTVSIAAPTVCFGTHATIIATTVPTGNYSYLWAVPGSVGNPGNTNNFTTTTAGYYSVTVTDNNSCNGSEDYTITFYTNPVLVSNIEDATCPTSNDGNIMLTVTDGTEPYQYSWSDGSSVSQLTNISSGLYAVTISDYNNCVATDTFLVNTLSEGCLNIPTAFSPNGDGINDTWEIEHIELYEEIAIEIYNRWGQLIFTYSGSGKDYADLSNHWDGTYNGKELPVSSFVFTLDLKDGKKPIQGIVSIIK